MKALIWTSAAAIIIGVLFVGDAVLSYPTGSIFETDPEVYRNVILSSSVGFCLIGIGVLAALLALHARAVGQQTRRALAEQAEQDRRQAERDAVPLRFDTRS